MSALSFLNLNQSNKTVFYFNLTSIRWMCVKIKYDCRSYVFWRKSNIIL